MASPCCQWLALRPHEPRCRPNLLSAGTAPFPKDPSTKGPNARPFRQERQVFAKSAPLLMGTCTAGRAASCARLVTDQYWGPQDEHGFATTNIGFLATSPGSTRRRGKRRTPRNFFAALKRRKLMARDGNNTCFPYRPHARMEVVNRSNRPPRVSVTEALSPFKSVRWLQLTPAERLRRSWALRKRLPDLRAVHDCKLFPKP